MFWIVMLVACILWIIVCIVMAIIRHLQTEPSAIGWMWGIWVGWLCLGIVCIGGLSVKLVHEATEIRTEASSEMTLKLSQCIDEGYTFVVDGTELKTIDENTLNYPGYYNITIDNKSKIVIMTTKQSDTSNNSGSTHFMPLFLPY